MARTVSFYDTRRRPADPLDAIRAEIEASPKSILARSLMEPIDRPAYGGIGEGLARVGSRLTGALLEKQQRKEMEKRQGEVQNTIMRALMGEQINRAPGPAQDFGGGVTAEPIGRAPNTQADMARILAGNPDTAGMGFNLRLQEMERQRALAEQRAAEQRAFAQRKELAGMPRPGLSEDAFNQQMELAAAKRSEQAGPDIGTFNPRDYTADSFARFMQSGDPNDLERFQRYKQIGGQIYDMSGEEPPRPVADVTEALKSGKVAEAEGGVEGRGEITPKEQQEQGRSRLSGTLETMVDSYLKLDEMEAIVNPDRGTLENLGTRFEQSGIGQFFGGAVGAEGQSIRRRIINAQPVLIQQIRQATGMSARGMDSNRELQFYLQAATDPTTGDIYSNLVAIQVLDDTFGLGGILEKTLPKDVYKRVKEQAESERKKRPITITPDQKDVSRETIPNDGAGGDDIDSLIEQYRSR